jgi:hypothetical protein
MSFISITRLERKNSNNENKAETYSTDGTDMA